MWGRSIHSTCFLLGWLCGIKRVDTACQCDVNKGGWSKGALAQWTSHGCWNCHWDRCVKLGVCICDQFCHLRTTLWMLLSINQLVLCSSNHLSAFWTTLSAAQTVQRHTAQISMCVDGSLEQAPVSHLVAWITTRSCDLSTHWCLTWPGRCVSHWCDTKPLCRWL